MGVRITRNASLKALNTFAVSASTAKLVELFDASSLNEALDACAPEGLDLVLGGGSNLLFTRSLDGAVLRVATDGYRLIQQEGSEVIVQAEAGAAWHQFVMWTLKQGWSGLENLALIPGSVGASPIQNIGAYGVELLEQFVGLDAVNVRSGQQREFLPEACGLAYRSSVFKRPEFKDWLILRVRFKLSTAVIPRIGYGEIRTELAKNKIHAPAARDVAEAVIRVRTRKLPSPTELGNAGSFFKNPVVPETLAQEMLRKFPGMPQFAAPVDGTGVARTKISAAWLIEQCGWKGTRRGDAGVYAHHSLVLVNHGSATGMELLKLAQDIQESVAARFGIQLEPEPEIV